MAEELKEIIDMIAKVPETALWILGGFALYKIVTYLSVTGSIVVVLRTAINKYHAIQVKKQEVKQAEIEQPLKPKLVNLEGIMITTDGTYENFKRFLKEEIAGVISGEASRKIYEKRIQSGDPSMFFPYPTSEYIHNRDLQWLMDVVKKHKMEQANKEETKNGN